MYALAIIRYRRPRRGLAHHDAHRAYLQGLRTRHLVASGPLEPRYGVRCC